MILKGCKRDHRQNEKACPCPCPGLERMGSHDLSGGWFSALGGFKTLIGALGLIPGACLILASLVPLELWLIKTIINAVTEIKTATHVIIL
jgi:hypothetical protein